MRFYIILLALVIGFSSNVHSNDTLPPVQGLSNTQKISESSILPAVKQYRKTHPEKVIFTQIKLASDTVDVETFAKQSPFYQKAQDIDKSAVLFSEYNRIGNNFNLHDEKNPIIVHTRIRGDEYSSLQDLIVFDEFHDKTYFKFDMYGYNVGIVPEKIEKFSHLQLSKPRAEAFFEAISGSGEAIAEFVLIPTFADTKEPLKINDKDMWLMFARVAEFRLWNDSIDNKRLLWFYRAPWYSPEDNENIEDLFIKE
jgi:hypothetical protein